LQAYAPHGYDLVTDTRDVEKPCKARVQLIFRRHAETARRLGIPMLVGEWGAYGQHSNAEQAAWDVVRELERSLASETYWMLERNFERLSYFPAVSRPYPERVSGRLLAYHYDPETGEFTCTWDEDPRVKAPSKIFLPGWARLVEKSVEVQPRGEGYRVVPLSRGASSAFLCLKPTGQKVRRELRLRLEKR
ncbi:MAG: glycoside hydrolase family 5 protein, partial [Calditrichaeota bacterium]|nr:glycoside hydrolase family 5 protein [Calditrichota bacterium]